MTTTRVAVVVPFDSSTIITADGKSHNATLDATGRRIVLLSPADAQRLLSSGLPSCVAWREANPQLADVLGPMPKPGPGIRIASLTHSEPPLTTADYIAQMRGLVVQTARTLRGF